MRDSNFVTGKQEMNFKEKGRESSRHSHETLTLWGEGASLALAGHLSSDGITINTPYEVDVLHRPASHLIFCY